MSNIKLKTDNKKTTDFTDDTYVNQFTDLDR